MTFDRFRQLSLDEVMGLWRSGLCSRSELFTLLLQAAEHAGFEDSRRHVPAALMPEFDEWVLDIVRAPAVDRIGLSGVPERVLAAAAEFYRTGGGAV